MVGSLGTQFAVARVAVGILVAGPCSAAARSGMAAEIESHIAVDVAVTSGFQRVPCRFAVVVIVG